MSAREALIRSVYSKLSQNQMEELVDNFAHELAEKQRALPLSGAEAGVRDALANLIDPEVSNV